MGLHIRYAVLRVRSATAQVVWGNKMARLDELAEGIAAVLIGSSQPEPLPVAFSGQSPSEIAFLARAVADACERQGRPLAYIMLPDKVVAILTRDPSVATFSVLIVRNGVASPDSIEFGRFPHHC